MPIRADAVLLNVRVHQGERADELNRRGRAIVRASLAQHDAIQQVQTPCPHCAKPADARTDARETPNTHSTTLVGPHEPHLAETPGEL